MTIYTDAADGVLQQAALDEFWRTHKIDDPSTEQGNGTIGLTLLALASRNGHLETTRLLLDKGAEADALSSQNRTPLWIVTARGRGSDRAAIIDLLLKHGSNAKYSHPDLLSGSTPLENELKQLKDLEVIQLLVDNGGITDAAKTLAGELKNSDIDDAMQSNSQRTKLRTTIIELITALILFILAWANSAVVSGIANKVFKKFQISGNKDSAMARKIAAEVPEPKSKEEFKGSIKTFVEKHKLHKFFPNDDDPLLETLVSKALDLQTDDNSVLGQSTNTENLVNFALYQPIIYCDDSGSMDKTINKQGEDRITDQRNLVRQIASICTKLVPENLGVHLRFINERLPHANNLRMDDIENMMSQVEPTKWTEIGINLRKQILDPFVYGTDMTKNRPLFISIITDGVPGGEKNVSQEKRDTLKNEIIECKKYLLREGLSPRAVIFQLSQIGSDPDSKKFLDSFTEDPRTKSVYVTSKQLDAKYRELRGNATDLEAWLLNTLLTPILDQRFG